MKKSLPISALFEALTQNMSAAELKSSMLIADISARISIERCNRGMTQKEFSTFMGVSQGMVSKWESGDYNFTIEAVCNILDKLGLDCNFEIIKDNETIEFSDIKFDLVEANTNKSIINTDIYNLLLAG